MADDDCILRMREQRTALVTGANRGIGLEVCRQLAAKGYRVILTARDRRKGDAAAAALRAAGDVTPAVLDVTDARAITALARDLGRRGVHVDALVDNAAVLVGESRGVLETPVDELRTTFETKLFGVGAVSPAFVAAIVGRRFGPVG